MRYFTSFFCTKSCKSSGVFLFSGFFVFWVFLAVPHGLPDLYSPTRDRTRAMAVKAQNPNH